MFRTVDLKTNPRLDCKKLEPGNGTLNLDSIFGEAIAQPGLSSILEKDKREGEPEVSFVQSVNYLSRNFDDETKLQVEDGHVIELTSHLKPSIWNRTLLVNVVLTTLQSLRTSGNGIFKKLCGNDLAASTRLTSIGNDLTLRFSTGKFPAIVVSMKAVSEHPGGR